MYPLSRWWLDFGLSRWEASKCNSECLGLHSWCVTYNVCLQTDSYLRWSECHREFLEPCSKEPTFTGSSCWRRWQCHEGWACGVLEQELTLYDSGGPGDVVSFSPEQKEGWTSLMRTFFPLCLSTLLFFFLLLPLLQFPDPWGLLAQYFSNISYSFVYTFKIFANSYNQHWCIYYFLKLICLAFFFFNFTLLW